MVRTQAPIYSNFNVAWLNLPPPPLIGLSRNGKITWIIIFIYVHILTLKMTNICYFLSTINDIIVKNMKKVDILNNEG